MTKPASIQNRLKRSKICFLRVYKLELTRADIPVDTAAQVLALDSFHRRTITDYKSPIIGAATPLSMIQYDLNLELEQPMYTTAIRNYFNTQFTLELAVAKYNEKFRFIIDTGSGTTLLNEKRCTTQGCQSRKAFNSKQSPTYTPFGRLIKINYAKGGVTIELAKDTFFFEDLKVLHQEFGVILNEEGLFQAASYDGIIGFSYPTLSDNTKPFFDRIIELRVLPKNIFSMYLSRNKEKMPSQLLLGGFNSSLIAGPIEYFPVVKKSWWTLKLDKVLINGIDSFLCTPQRDCKIIMDTGSSLMATPPWALNTLLSQISRFSDCRNIRNFPDITFVINGKNYVIQAYEYVLTSMRSINYELNPNLNKSLGEGDCTFGFSIFDVGKENVWIAGDIFLSKYYTIYDRDNDRVGLALAKQF